MKIEDLILEGLKISRSHLWRLLGRIPSNQIDPGIRKKSLNLKIFFLFRWQVREKFQKVDLDHDPIDDDRADQHPLMILRHVDEDDPK